MRSFLSLAAIGALLAGGLPAALASPSGAVAEAEAPSVLTGQVTCSACWLEADRSKVPYGGAADLDCAARCASEGIPAALAVREGEGWTLYLLDAGGFDPGRRGWLPWVAKHVRVSGTLHAADGKKTIRVDSIEAAPPTPAAAGGAGTPAGAHGGDAPQVAASVGPAELVLEDLDGFPQSLASLRGRIVILNYWATWCAPCRKEMPLLTRLQRKYAWRGVQVVGASADTREDRGAVIRFAESSRVGFPLWLGATTEDMERHGLSPALPGTVVLDREGRVTAHFSGVVERKELEEEIERLLAAAPGAGSEVAAARHDAGRHSHAHSHRGGRGSLVPS